MRAIMLLLLAAFFPAPSNAGADTGWAPTPDGAKIHYRRSGTGEALVLVPGWSFSGEIFASQIEHFSSGYEVIAIDPRGQGKSSKGAEGNSYAQHGADLKAALDHLGIGRAHFVGWSWGCYDVLSLVRLAGADAVRSFVCLDEPPAGWSTDPGQWAGLHSLEQLAGLYHGVTRDREAFTQWFVPWMVTRSLSEAEYEQLADMSYETPDHVATALAVDGMLSDYTAEAQLLDNLTPVLFIIREELEPVARIWMAAQMPGTQLLFKGGHLNFWEFPEEINGAIEAFLRGAAAPSH